MNPCPIRGIRGPFATVNLIPSAIHAFYKSYFPLILCGILDCYFPRVSRFLAEIQSCPKSNLAEYHLFLAGYPCGIAYGHLQAYVVALQA